MSAVSKKQQQIYEYICRCIKERGYPPSVREIGSAVNLRSPSTVHKHLGTLERAGLIARASGKTRAITLPQGSPSGIPILGSVTAGQPVLATQDILGYLPWPVEEEDSCFALRIRGDSMKNAGILDGDTVVVRRQPVAENGEIIIALLEDEATCKRFSRKGDEIWLLPENEAYDPIKGDGLVILGKVTMVVRTY